MLHEWCNWFLKSITVSQIRVSTNKYNQIIFQDKSGTYFSIFGVHLVTLTLSNNFVFYGGLVNLMFIVYLIVACSTGKYIQLR